MANAAIYTHVQVFVGIYAFISFGVELLGHILVLHLTLFFFFFFFFWLPLWHVEVPWLGVELELHLLVYTPFMAMPDLSYICNLCSSLWQHLILNPRCEARD